MTLLFAFLMQAPGSACAPCHPAIVQQYAASTMARTSGVANAGGAAAEFTAWDGMRVRVAAGSRMSFAREGEPGGERQLGWFLGSGRVGRSFLFALDGWLFQAPVSYYTQGGRWAPSPGFDRQPAMDLARAVEPSCLQCHTTRPQPAADTHNRYARQPFAEAGIGCERCHGAAAGHLAAMRLPGARRKSTGIVNPSQLEPARRDSVCAQCHLTGATRVARLRRAEYQPGARLSDSLAVFVWSDARSASLTVTSHFEKLSYSRCQAVSGSKLWCASCHDPHGEPAPEKRAEFYRGKCQSCHDAEKRCTAGSAARQAVQDDCTACHMPKADFASEHGVYTNHGIPRRAGAATPFTGERKLTPFALVPGDERDRALAYAVAAMTEPVIRREAFDLLRAAELRDPADTVIASQLAQFYDRLRQPERALPLLERVTKQDPSSTAAAANLGSLYAQQGRMTEAKQWWLAALKRHPAMTGVRLNLAVALSREGDRAGALAAVKQALVYDPDAPAARRLLDELSR